MTEFSSNYNNGQQIESDLYSEADLKVMQEFVDEMTRIHENPLFAEEEEEEVRISP